MEFTCGLSVMNVWNTAYASSTVAGDGGIDYMTGDWGVPREVQVPGTRYY